MSECKHYWQLYRTIIERDCHDLHVRRCWRCFKWRLSGGEPIDLEATRAHFSRLMEDIDKRHQEDENRPSYIDE